MIGSDIMTIPAASQSLYGKSVGDMIGSDVKVMEDGAVEGTFIMLPDTPDSMIRKKVNRKDITSRSSLPQWERKCRLRKMDDMPKKT